MTVSSSTNRDDYSGNGSTVNFAVNFRFLANSHVKVILTSATGVETTQVETTNYTLTGAGDASGGTLTMFVAPATGETLTILRNVPFTQETDYVENDAFPAESHEQALDKLTMIIQQQKEEIDRSLKLTESQQSSGLTIPSPVENNLLRWDSNGDLINVTEQQLGTVAEEDIVKKHGTVALMKSDTSLVSGRLVDTSGYTTIGDGGGAKYLIQTTAEFGGTPDEKGDHTLSNGNIAVLQINGMRDVRQYGDDIQAAIDSLPSGGGNVLCKGKTFTITSPLTWAKNRVGLFGDGATINGSGFSSGYMVEPGDETALFTHGGITGLYFTHNGSPTGIINVKGITNFQINFNRFENGGTACVKSQGCFFLAARGNRINGQFSAGFLFQKAETLGFVSNNALLENNWIKLNNLSNAIGVHIQDGSQNVMSINNYYEDIGDTLGSAKAIWCDTSGTSPNNAGGVGFSSIDDTFEDCDYIADLDNNGLVISNPLIGPGNTNGVVLDGDGCRVYIQTVTNAVTNDLITVSASAQFSDITVPNPQSNVVDSGSDTQSIDPRNGRKTIGSYLYKDKVIVKTTDTTLSELDSGSLINNEGSSATITTTLPALSASVVGTRYTFVRNQATFAHRIDPNGTDRIRNGATVGAAGKYLQIDTNGGSVTLVASTTSFWEVVSEIGTNSFEP